MGTLKKEVGKFKIDAEIRICSAHKQPSRLQSVIAEYNKADRPVMMVGCAGGTDALSARWHEQHLPHQPARILQCIYRKACKYRKICSTAVCMSQQGDLRRTWREHPGENHKTCASRCE